MDDLIGSGSKSRNPVYQPISQIVQNIKMIKISKIQNLKSQNIKNNHNVLPASLLNLTNHN